MALVPEQVLGIELGGFLRWLQPKAQDRYWRTLGWSAVSSWRLTVVVQPLCINHPIWQVPNGCLIMQHYRRMQFRLYFLFDLKYFIWENFGWIMCPKIANGRATVIGSVVCVAPKTNKCHLPKMEA